MSAFVAGKPFTMYSDQELIDLLDRITCIGNIDPMFCALAEASSRSMRASLYARQPESKGHENER